MPCCRPSQGDDDRTHSIYYWQAFYDGDPGDDPVFEESGWLDVACTHNDAISMAATEAARVEVMHGIGMSNVGSGRWRARDYERGHGTKFEIWIDRGLAEKDYDKQRLLDTESSCVV